MKTTMIACPVHDDMCTKKMCLSIGCCQIQPQAVPGPRGQSRLVSRAREVIVDGVKVKGCLVEPDDANPKDIAGRSKPQLHLIPASALVPVARVMELGAKKYGPYNWRDQPVAYTPYLSAAMRHITAFLNGETIDPESGQSHIAHAAAGLLILEDAIVNDSAKDDRPKCSKTNT